jgi:ABC-type phosphate transport system auxiliary subunit
MALFVDENTPLLDEIEVLLAGPLADEHAPYLQRVEHTLTSGYARALALEAERGRLQQRLGELAATLDGGDLGRNALELSDVARRFAATDGDLRALRGRLASLRAHARDVRRAAA